MIYKLAHISLLLFTSLQLFAQNSDHHLFFNQPVPGTTAVVFAPGIVSDELGNRDMAIAPDASEFFYTIQYRGGQFSVIMQVQKINGKWSKPEVANFCGHYNDLEPAYSPDGNKLYFASNRPIPGSNGKDYNIWYVSKQNGNWIDPTPLQSAVNTSADEFYPSLTKTGNLYFTRAMKGKGEDIVLCKWVNEQYEEAVSLPGVINTAGDEFNAFVDADEQYIIYSGYKRKGAYGIGDLYISKKNEQGEWGESSNLGNSINATGLTYCPYVSPDKKYFFFSSSRNSIIKIPFEQPQTIRQLKEMTQQPLNGWDNIYWISTEQLLK